MRLAPRAAVSDPTSVPLCDFRRSMGPVFDGLGPCKQRRTKTMKNTPGNETAAPLQPLPSLQLPDGPYVTRAGATPVLTDSGRTVIETMAAEGCTQNKIASTLGVSARTFKTLLGKTDDDPPSPARTAWESGRSTLESDLVRLALAGARKGDMIRQMFLLKSQFGHRDQGPTTVVDASARIQFVLPGSMSESDYYKSLGISGPIDTRPEHLRGLSPYEALGLCKPSQTQTNKPEN